MDVLPKTLDGKASSAVVDFLASVRIASLEPEKFAYANGYLASASRGGEGAVTYVYEYNAYGQRTSRRVTSAGGETTEGFSGTGPTKPL